MKRLTDMDQAVARFYERIEPLAASPKMGPVLWQLPENFHRDDARLEHALDNLPPGRHAFEFRHPSWFEDTIYQLLADHDVALVIGDDPHRPFQTYEFTTDFTFIRFHGGKRGRYGNYSDSEIHTWADRVGAWGDQRPVYAYFNNDWNAYAINNARLLTKLVSG